MTATDTSVRATQLEDRLRRGAELLLDMEARGDMGPRYEEWLGAWLELLSRYLAVAAGR